VRSLRQGLIEEKGTFPYSPKASKAPPKMKLPFSMVDECLKAFYHLPQLVSHSKYPPTNNGDTPPLSLPFFPLDERVSLGKAEYHPLTK